MGTWLKRAGRAACGLLAGLALAGCAGEPGDGAPPAADHPAILSAFFGLDDALPLGAVFLCPGSFRKDGMPVTLGRRVVADKVDPAAFRVITASGNSLEPWCATARPATAASELHTILLIGELGDAATDPPVRVEIVGSLPLRDGGDARGESIARVTPLADGPRLVLALRYDPAGLPSSRCDPDRTRQIVQVTFEGGVKALDGGELGDEERQRFEVAVREPDGRTRGVVPFALADLNDMDNYVQLCLDTAAEPVSVTLRADTVIDPNGDPNPETAVAVTEDP